MLINTYETIMTRYKKDIKLRLEKVPHKQHPAFVCEPEWLKQGREGTRQLVRYRDNFTCQDCHKKWIKGQRRFDVHHLHGLCGKMSTGYDRRNTIHKLITLCHKSHFNRPEHATKKRAKKVVHG